MRQAAGLARLLAGALLIGAALAGCAQEERETTVEAQAEDAVFPAADGGTATGRFEISSAEGNAMMVQEVFADGTYRNLRDGRITETGTWTMPERGLFCTTSDGRTSCDEESIAPDGTWISVNVEDAAVRWIVRRLAETSEPPAG